MSRIQIALNVSNVNEAVAFYSKLFGATPTKQRPGYANFAIAQPPLKLVLIENEKTAGTLNHLGIEVETSDEVAVASDRFKQLGLATKSEEQVNCCYAVQDKVWVSDPDGSSWEVYTVLGDSEAFCREESTKETINCCKGDSC
jgi:catechol 2,3-dioxygenase-like lactoylglutathione lyase family enzyme